MNHQYDSFGKIELSAKTVSSSEILERTKVSFQTLSRSPWSFTTRKMISSYSCYKAILWHKGLGWWPFRNEYVPAGIYAGEPILLNMIHRQLYHDFAEWINRMTHKPLHTRMYFGARRSRELCQANVFPTDVNLRVTNDQITGRMYSRVFLCMCMYWVFEISCIQRSGRD